MSEPGRRTATGGRRLHPTALIGIALVVLTVGALLLVRPHESASRAEAPDETTLTTASVGCPTAVAGADAVSVATGAKSADGEVRVGVGDDAEKLPVASGEVSTLRRPAGPGRGHRHRQAGACAARRPLR